MTSETTDKSYQGPLGLDKIPTAIKLVIWIFCFLITTSLANKGYDHVKHAIYSTPMTRYLLWTAMFSPICIAVNVLRLAGIKWRFALSLFIAVPFMVFGRILLMRLLYAAMGD